MKQIENEWQISKFPGFLRPYIPTESFDIQTNTHTQVFRRCARKYERTPAFVFGISGSSVTAGHDNYYNESYPAVIQRTPDPVFKALTIPLEVRNGAMGNNPCMPTTYACPLFWS